MRYKILIIKVLAIIMISLSSVDVFSQSDGFFNNWSDFSSREGDDIITPAMPGHGFDTDQSAPLGSGLLILLGLGAGYLALKKRSSLKKTTAAALVLLSLPAMSQQLEYDWKVVKGDCNNPMTVCAKVVEDGTHMTNAQYEIGVFCGDECRGKNYCNVIGAGNYVAYILVYGKTGDNFTFKVYDHNNQWVIFADCFTNIGFDSSNPVGTLIDPVQVAITKINYIFHGGLTTVLSNYTLSNETAPVKLPLRNCKVIYEGDAEYSDGNTDLKDIVIEENRTVTIGAGSGLSAALTVTNNAGVDGIVIESAAPQPTAKGDYWNEKFSSVGSLVSLSPGVEGTFNMYVDNSATEHDWHFISSPITTQAIYNEMIPNDFTPGKTDDFYLFDETKAMWRNIKTDGFSTGNEFYQLNDNSFDFIPGHGYLASYSAQGTKQFKGVFNQGDVTVNLTKTDLIAEEENKLAGFNLVGNPYPSFLDWENVDGWNRSRIYGYNAEPDESHCVMWIYNEDEGNYSVYVQGGGGISTLHATQYIAPGQAFFVKATQAGSFVMRDAARTNEHAKSGFMKGQDLLVRQDEQDLQDDLIRQDGQDLQDDFRQDEQDLQDGLIRQDEQDLQDVLKIRVENEKLGADEVALAISGNEMKIEKLFGMSETAPAMYFNENKGKYSIIINNDFENSIMLNFKAKQMGKYTIKLNPETAGCVVPTDFESVRDFISDCHSPDEYPISGTRVIATKGSQQYYLGHITVRIDGTITYTGHCNWTFSGTLSALDDRYDFNASNRGQAGETLTKIGRALFGAHGTPFTIHINGTKSFAGSGHCGDKQ